MGREERAARHESVVAAALPSSYNRRIGIRVVVDPAAEVSWLPLLPPPRFGRKRRAKSGLVVELSLTGAHIKAPADVALAPGTLVAIGVHERQGIVEIRRVHAAIDPAVAFYGVQFVRLDRELQDLVDRTIAARRVEDIEWRWHNADP